jgi:hypothetical protein
MGCQTCVSISFVWIELNAVPSLSLVIISFVRDGGGAVKLYLIDFKWVYMGNLDLGGFNG